jgi:hypothetical protein
VITNKVDGHHFKEELPGTPLTVSSRTNTLVTKPHIPGHRKQPGEMKPSFQERMTS